MFSEKSQKASAGASGRSPSQFGERSIELGRDGIVRAYVAATRSARRLAAASGLLREAGAPSGRPRDRFARSLLSVHDIEEMDRLDLAWWTFAAIERVDAFLRGRGGQARAFEYGAGASTLWLARRCGHVVSVEHDSRWWPGLAANFRHAENVTASLVEPVPSDGPTCASQRAGWRGMEFAPYVRAIRAAGGPFDLVVIDGRARPSCLREAVDHLAPNGVILFDNSDRRRYGAAIGACGLAVERHRGLAPAVPWPSETALLARDAKVLRGS